MYFVLITDEDKSSSIKLYNTPVCVYVHQPLRVGRESSHEIKELLNLLPLVLKARYPSGSAFRWNLRSGCHLHLGLVVENKINHNFQVGSACYAGFYGVLGYRVSTHKFHENTSTQMHTPMWPQ